MKPGEVLDVTRALSFKSLGLLLLTFALCMPTQFAKIGYSFRDRLEKPANCTYNNRIVLDLETSGLSNRLYALVSVSMLAAVTNRVLEVDWRLDKGTRVPFHELFDVLRSKWGHMKAFMLKELNETDPHILYRSAVRNATSCRIDLSQHGGNTPLFFYDSELFQLVDQSCTVIHIYRANGWYGHEVLNLAHLFENRHDHYATELVTRLEKLKTAYPAPFHDFMNFIYRPKEALIEQEKAFRKLVFKGKPYLSIHSRGFYEDGNGTALISRCAKQLLDNGNVSYVFLATESKKIKDIAASIIPQNLVTLTKKYVENDGKDSDELRKTVSDMVDAALEWMLVGSADYCMAVTAGKSTFSQTSIVHGSCKYIPFHKKLFSVSPYDCVHLEAANYTGHMFDVKMYIGEAKEILTHGKDIDWKDSDYQLRIDHVCGNQFKFPLSNENRQLWWANITKEELPVTFQCIKEESTRDYVEKYYFSNA